MFNNSPQPGPNLPPPLASPKLEPQLPRGECGFILPDHDPQTGSRQRCNCRSFFPDHVVRSRCGCGHQAWHHEAQPLSSVSMEEHLALVEEVKKLRHELRKFARIKHELAQERLRREELKQTWNQLHQRQYQVMRDLKLHIDDKVEAVVDKSQEISDSLKTLHAKVMAVEDNNFELENKLDRIEQGRDWRSRSLTPVMENSLEHSVEKPMMIDPPSEPMPMVITHQLPIRTEKKSPLTWSAKVVLAPNRSQNHAFEYDSIGMRRLQSRNLQQEIIFTGTDSRAFVESVEAHFKYALRGRPWVPLTGYRPEDEPYGRIVLKQLPVHLAAKETWDRAFIDRECVIHDKMQGDLLYIALEHEQMSWADIRWLPSVPGFDDSCWAHDDELDGSKPLGFKSLDSELMYDYSEPPPYSSRTHPDMDRLPSRLDMLAHASSMLPLADSSTPPSASIRSAFSDMRSVSEKSVSDISYSEKSISTMELSDDEHRDKKLRMKASMPTMGSSGGSSSGAPSMYVSGRSKRKMPNNGKMKEAVHWNVDSLARPLHAIRKNRTAVKDNKVEPAQS